MVLKVIRKIKEADISEICLLGKNYIDNFEILYDLKSYINSSIYIVNCFEEDNIIKGFIIANFLYENVEILLVFVKAEYRNRGIASELLKSLEVDSVEKLLLEVSVLNDPALKLYDKMGYKIISTRKKYYNGVDAYVMRKEL
ncbi:MAG: GNAT family N-acetyltransferase [Firmicutes bacterium]|nr:GNAT family N-acetyltransferase [Bacillota bacterium]